MDRSFDAKTSTGQEPRESNWTLAVDLAVDLRDQTGKVTGAGSFDHWQQLKSLAEKTAQAPVSVVVTVPRIDALASDLNDFKQGMAEADVARQNGQLHSDTGPLVDTYLVSGGKVQFVESHFSTGLHADVQQLLQTAQKVAPSKYLGLNIMAHGWGTEVGMTTDQSTSSTAELHDAIKAGLGTRSRLDVLDLDSCQMASTNTATRMQDVARYMVASADDEAASMEAHFDGQNIGNAVSDLIAHPDKTPKQFASDLVAQADSGANGIPSHIPEIPKQLRAGTDSLVAIDMDRYKQFEDNLNTFARILHPHLENASDRKALATAIDSTSSFPSHKPNALNELRDTKQFAQQVIKQIDQHKLTDDGTLRKAAENLISSQQAMTERLHKNPALYGDIGGITTFLPVTSAASRRELVTSRFGIQAALADIPQWQQSYAYKPLVLGNAQLVVGATAMGLSEQDKKQFSGLQKAESQLAAANNQQDYAKAVQELKQQARQFMKTPLAARLVSQTESMVHPTDGKPERSEWTAVVDELVSRSIGSK